MLISIKNRSTGIFAWIIVLLIVIPFALFGIQSYFQQGENAAVAEVNGEEILKTEYQYQLQQRTAELEQQFGESFDPAMLEASGVKLQIINDLINRRLYDQYVKANNFQISDSTVSDNIKQQFLFDGVFNMDAYQRFLSSRNITARQFEESQRQQMRLQQLTGALSDSVFITPQQVNQFYRIQAQNRELEYIELIAEDFADQINITEQDIEQYYQQNKPQFEQPLQVKVSYVELNVDDLIAGYEPTADEIQAAYEQLAQGSSEPDIRKASHILISPNEQRDFDQARSLAAQLLQRISQGENFAELAKEYSDDIGSARNGGDLGLINEGTMVESFESALFALEEEDQVSDLVETEFGVHIIKLTELQLGSKPSFEQLENQSKKLAAKTLASSEFADLKEQLDAAIFDQPENLAAIASELGLTLKESVWFNAQGAVDLNQDADIAMIPVVRNAAFSADVLDAGLTSPVLDVSENRALALQIKEQQEAYTQNLAEIRDEVVSQLRQSRLEQLLVQTGEKHVQFLEQSKLTKSSWLEWLQQNNFTAKNFTGTRDDLPAELLTIGQTVFSMPKPGNDEYTVQGERLIDGRYVVLVLKSVEDAVPNDNDSEAIAIKQQIQEFLQREESVSTFNSFTQSLRSDASIYIDEEQL